MIKNSLATPQTITQSSWDQEQVRELDKDGNEVVDLKKSIVANLAAAEQADVSGALKYLFSITQYDHMNASEVINNYSVDLIQAAGYSIADVYVSTVDYLKEKLDEVISE